MNLPVDEAESVSFFEALRWPEGIISPFDPMSRIYKCKHQHYRCRNSGKYFNVKTGTLMSRSRLSLFDWAHLLFSDHSQTTVQQLAMEYGISLKSAYALKQKLNLIGPVELKSESDKFSLTEWLKQMQS